VSGVSSEKIKSSTQSITQLADAPVPSEVHVQVWEALPVMLTAPGGAVGNTGDEPDSLDSLDGEFTTEANATSVSLRNFQPGRYTIQVYPRIGFEGRIVPIEFGTNVNGQSRTLRVGL
jgi:hypothetical protein